MRLKLVPGKTSIDFLGMRRIAVPVSILLMIASLALVVVQGLNFGIDFKGGSSIMVETPQAVPVSEFRAVLNAAEVGDTTVTEIEDPAEALTGVVRHQALIRIEQQGDDPAIQNDAIVRVKTDLTSAFPGITFLSTDSVGGKVSGELIEAGALAVALAVLVVLFYIWLRFEWQFSVGAVAALIHDVILTLGIFSLLQLEFNLSVIAALLTIVGYSLNDTVVVFDRVRENLRKYKKLELTELLNLSLNETLSRTVMTSVTTLLALTSLYIFGGEVIRVFTFAMIFGVIVGTYSSVFVAAVAVHWLGVDRSDKPNAKAGTNFADIDA